MVLLIIPACFYEIGVIQYGPFIRLYLGFIGMDCVISEICYKGTILQQNSRKVTMK